MRQRRKGFIFVGLHGFTLIELLVVIAIISLLVSILLPSLNKVKDLAKAAACGVNSRNIGTAMALYVSDMDGYFPYMWYDGRWMPEDEYPYHRGYRVALDPYLDNVEHAWKCPARGFPTEDDPSFFAYGSKAGSAYIYNYALCAVWSDYKKIEQVDNSSEIVGFAEYVNTNWVDVVNAPNRVWPNLVEENWRTRLGFPHPPTSMNINFVDGHVERISAGDVLPSMFYHTWTP